MRLRLLGLALLAMIAGLPAVFASDDTGCEEQGAQCTSCSDNQCTSCRCASCPKCGELCFPTVKDGKKEKHCWKVKAKTICIPKVRFPWEKDCCDDCCCDKGCPQPKCGRTKCVKVLMKHEYECHECKYSWTPEPCHCGNGSGSCDAAPAPPADHLDAPTPPPEEARLPSEYSERG